MLDKITKEKLISLINSIGEYELRIDFDNRDNFGDFLTRIHLIQRSLGLAITNIKVYDTKNGYHIWINLENPLTRYEVILIQLLLGDDYKHALASFNQLRSTVPPEHWNKLFHQKFYLNQVGQVFLASEEHYNKELSVKALISLTCQIKEESEKKNE